MRETATLIRRRPFAAFGSGLLAALGWLLGVIAIGLVLIIAAIVFGILTFGELVGVIGFAALVLIGMITFTLFLIVSYLAEAIVGLGLATFVRRTDESRWLGVGLLAAGSAVVVLLTSLPVVGGPIKLIVVILGLGLITLGAWSARPGRRAEEPSGAPAI